MAMTGSTRYEVQVDAVGSQSLTALIKSLSDATRAEAMMTKALAETQKQERLAEAQRQRLAKTTDELARSTQAAANQNSRLNSLGAAFSKNGAAIQNFGRQAQDVAVQVGMGTSAFRALGQQLPQLLDSFGPLGAVIGTVAAVALPFAANLFEAEEAAADLSESTDALAASVDAVRTAFMQSQQPLAEWGTYSVSAAEGLRSLSSAMLALSQANAAVQMSSTLEAINAQTAAVDEQALAWTRLEQLREDLQNFDPSGGTNLEAVNAQIAELTEGVKGTLAQTQYVGEAFANLGKALTEGRPAEEVAKIVNGMIEWDKQAKVLTEEQRNILTESLKLSAQQTRSADLQRQITDAANGTTQAMAGTTAQAQQLADTLARGAAALSALGAATSNLNLDTDALNAQTASLKAGNDALQARADSLKAAKLAASAEGLNSPDMMIRKETITSIREYNEAVDRNVVAQRNNAKAMADSAKAATSTSKAVSAAGKATKDATKDIEDATKALNSALKEFMTPAEEAKAQLAELDKLIADVGGQTKLDPMQAELYRRAVQELNGTLDETKTLSEEIEDQLADGLGQVFSDIVDGTKSASDAWADMLLQMLRDLTKFLAQKQFQEFAAALVSSFAGAPTVAAPSVAAMAPANLSSAPTYAAPAMPRVQAGALVMPAAPIAPANGMTDRAGSFGNVFIENHTSSKIEARTEPDGQGGQDLRITLRDEVRGMVTSGALDNQLRTSFGLRRRGA
ncbi:hypothetical protein [Paracoccus sp. KR1-242]|uniref:hypothetical protein n=1 Tax=Paracoccus sp. KR1-242 TaxID=3410028 RepID=UPI003C0034DE